MPKLAFRNDPKDGILWYEIIPKLILMGFFGGVVLGCVAPKSQENKVFEFEELRVKQIRGQFSACFTDYLRRQFQNNLTNQTPSHSSSKLC